MSILTPKEFDAIEMHNCNSMQDWKAVPAAPKNGTFQGHKKNFHNAGGDHQAPGGSLSPLPPKDASLAPLPLRKDSQTPKSGSHGSCTTLL